MSADALPRSFSWLDRSDVAARFALEAEEALPTHFITPAGSDQGTCDSCWAYHLAQVVTDRTRIAHVLKGGNSPADAIKAVPALSPMNLLRQAGVGCCNVSFEVGIRLLATHGVCTASDDPYTLTNERCSHKRHRIEEKLAARTCSGKRYWLEHPQGVELSTNWTTFVRVFQRRIMRELWKSGPLLCRLTIFDDLRVLAARPNAFKATGSAYMNVETDALYAQAIRSTCTTDGSCRPYGHGIALVGYGRTTFEDVAQRGDDVCALLKQKLQLSDALLRDVHAKVERAWDARAAAHPGLLRLTKADMARLLNDAEQLDAVCHRQSVAYWVLRNSWGSGEDQILRVAHCGVYIIGGRERRVNYTVGIGYRFACSAGAQGKRITCGGVLSPGHAQLR